METIENWSYLIKEYLTNVRKITDEKRITDVINSFADNLAKKSNELCLTTAIKVHYRN